MNSREQLATALDAADRRDAAEDATKRRAKRRRKADQESETERRIAEALARNESLLAALERLEAKVGVLLPLTNRPLRGPIVHPVKGGRWIRGPGAKWRLDHRA